MSDASAKIGRKTGLPAAVPAQGFFSPASAMAYLDVGKTQFYRWLNDGIVPRPQIDDGRKLRRWTKAQLDAVAKRR